MSNANDPTLPKWSRDSDPFSGAIVRIYGLSYDRPTLDTPNGPKKNGDYVALLLGTDDKYGYARRFLRYRNGVCVVPVDTTQRASQFCGVTLDGAVLEIRIDGVRHHMLVNAGGLEPIADDNIRPALAAWLFATGQSLHRGDQ
jgi:hypothetical protein